MDEQHGEQIVLRLYVAGQATMSVRALNNLKKIQEEYFKGNSQIEVIDVFSAPHRALADGILVTPTLIKVSPEPMVRIIGDLSAIERVVFSLGAE